MANKGDQLSLMVSGNRGNKPKKPTEKSIIYLKFH